MYIKTNGKNYKCKGIPALSGDPIRFYLPEGGPDSIGDTILLCMDDGTIMREINTTTYSRKQMEGNTLILTNQPEPEPIPEPEVKTETMTIEEALADMLADHEMRLSMLEIATAEGGTVD